MKAQVLISIIIPCYNQSQVLPKALQSVHHQTLGDWECIVVDDGSSDNTSAVVLAAAATDKRIKLLQKENGGSASARDMGLEHAKGKYIQFLDADDDIAPDKLERQTKLMQEHNLDISYTAFRNIYAGREPGPIRTVGLSLYRIIVSWGVGYSTPINSFMYNREFLLSNGITFKSSCRYREDWRFHIMCFSARPRVMPMPDCCGAMYYHGNESKTSSYQKMQKGNFTFMAYMSKELGFSKKLLWTLRISEELWVWLLRMFKYRSIATAKTITALCSNLHSIATFVGAILLMPVSIWWIIVYFVKTYLQR